MYISFLDFLCNLIAIIWKPPNLSLLHFYLQDVFACMCFNYRSNGIDFFQFRHRIYLCHATDLWNQILCLLSEKYWSQRHVSVSEWANFAPDNFVLLWKIFRKTRDWSFKYICRLQIFNRSKVWLVY
jgi:hypothetical protein